MRVCCDVGYARSLLASCFALGYPACPPSCDLVGDILADRGFDIDAWIECYGGVFGCVGFMFFDLTWRRG